jgi:hypothetical protein
MSITSVKSGATGISLALDNNFMEPIATTLVGSGGASIITFSDIPQTYKHLQIRGIIRNTRAVSSMGASLYIKLNSDSTSSNYNEHRLYGNGTTVYSDNPSASNNGMPVGDTPSASTTSNTFSGFVVDILDYANTSKYKTVRALVGADLNGGGSIGFHSGLWMNTNSIVSIDISSGSEGTAQYSRFSLYGIKG